MGENLRESSKRDFTSSNTIEHINAGSLQRIADATEAMAHRYNDLISEKDRYKRWYDSKVEYSAYLEKKISGLRGYITRLKKKLKEK